MLFRLTQTFAIIALSVLPLFAAAQSSIDVQIKAEIERAVTDANGEQKIERVEAKKVLPGQEIIYTILVENKGSEPATDVYVTDPIPEHMTYVDGSADSTEASVVFSVDDGALFDIAEKLSVTSANGDTVAAQAENYTHVRWQFKQALAVGSLSQVMFRATLD